MKIENETLYINKTDLDHILGETDIIYDRNIPPSELFKEYLEIELQLAGLDKTPYSKIELNFGWED